VTTPSTTGGGGDDSGGNGDEGPTPTTPIPIVTRITGALPLATRARTGSFNVRLGCIAPAGTTCSTTVRLTSRVRLDGRLRTIVCRGTGPANTRYIVRCNVARAVRLSLPTRGALFTARITLRSSDGQTASARGRSVRIR
jgi:hypothetical protein